MLKRLAFVAAFFFLATGWAGAQAIDADHVAAIAKSADSLVALAEGSEKTGQAPRATDPEAKPLIDVVLDTSVLDANAPITQDDLEPLEVWLRSVTKVGLIYILAGTGIEDFSAIGNDTGTLGQVDKNTVTFAPEMGRYYDATLRLEADMIAAVQDLVQHLDEEQLNRPNVAHGLQQVQGGVANTIRGDITTLPLEGLSDAWRRDRLAALQTVAPKAAAFLTSDQLADLHDLAIEVADSMSDPDVKQGLATFAASMTK